MTTERLELVDALRGFALMGLCLCHASELFEVYWIHYTPSVVHDTVFFLFEGKAFALFALMFGLSFFIIMDRSAQRGVDFSARFVWRLVLLAGFGYLHGLIYKGDVLKILALLGLLLVPAQRCRNPVLVVLAGLCLLELPIWALMGGALHGAAWAQHDLQTWTSTSPPYDIGSLAAVLAFNRLQGQVDTWWWYADAGRLPQIVGLFLTGLVLGRVGFFTTPQRFSRARRRALLLAIALAIILYFAKAPLVDLVPGSDQQFMARRSAARLIDCYFNLSVMTIWLTGFIEIYLYLGGSVLRHLAPAGRMTLTLYVTQSLIMVPIFYGFGLGMFDDVTQIQAVLLGTVVFALQLVYARAWFKRFYYGPLEWCWRSLTYLSIGVPFRRTPTTV